MHNIHIFILFIIICAIGKKNVSLRKFFYYFLIVFPLARGKTIEKNNLYIVST